MTEFKENLHVIICILLFHYKRVLEHNINSFLNADARANESVSKLS